MGGSVLSPCRQAIEFSSYELPGSCPCGPFRPNGRPPRAPPTRGGEHAGGGDAVRKSPRAGLRTRAAAQGAGGVGAVHGGRRRPPHRPRRRRRRPGRQRAGHQRGRARRHRGASDLPAGGGHRRARRRGHRPAPLPPAARRHGGGAGARHPGVRARPAHGRRARRVLGRHLPRRQQDGVGAAADARGDARRPARRVRRGARPGAGPARGRPPRRRPARPPRPARAHRPRDGPREGPGTPGVPPPTATTGWPAAPDATAPGWAGARCPSSPRRPTCSPGSWTRTWSPRSPAS